MHNLHYPRPIGNMLKEPSIWKMIFCSVGSDTIPRRTTFKFKYLREFEPEFEIVLGYESGAHMGSIHEKNQRPKISCYCTFKASLSVLPFSVLNLLHVTLQWYLLHGGNNNWSAADSYVREVIFILFAGKPHFWGILRDFREGCAKFSRQINFLNYPEIRCAWKIRMDLLSTYVQHVGQRNIK
jgi:hypothetical protein